MANNGGKRPGAGRKKGQLAKSTLDALAGKALLIQMYLENIRPINEALLKKAKEGDMQAIKELHDRVYGKAPQLLTGSGSGGAIQFEIVKYGDKDSTQVSTP